LRGTVCSFPPRGGGPLGAEPQEGEGPCGSVYVSQGPRPPSDSIPPACRDCNGSVHSHCGCLHRPMARAATSPRRQPIPWKLTTLCGLLQGSMPSCRLALGGGWMVGVLQVQRWGCGSSDAGPDANNPSGDLDGSPRGWGQLRGRPRPLITYCAHLGRP